MQVEAIPLTDFAHDELKLKRGRARLLDESLAREFESRGLVRIKMAVIVPRKVTPPGNSPAGGEAQRSVASPPALVLPPTITPTAPSSGHGQQKFLKRGR